MNKIINSAASYTAFSATVTHRLDSVVIDP